MPKGKKRKPDAISKAIRHSQLQHTYSPVIRSRVNRLSTKDMQLMHDDFLPNDNLSWDLTSNCKVVQNGMI